MRYVTIDTETYLIVPGRLIPRLVVLVVGDALHTSDTAGGVWRALLADPDTVLCGHNLAYDLAVLIEAYPDTLDAVFALLDAGRARCTMIREKLIAIAEGRYDFDPVRNRPAEYNLGALVQRYFGVDITGDKKDPTAWRLRYAELDGITLAEWPADAVRYPLDDVRWTAAVMDAQGTSRSVAGNVLVDADGWVTNERPQVAAHFALTLIAAWGVRTDPAAVAAWEAEITAEVNKGLEVGQRAGFVRTNGSVDTKLLRARVQAAYAARGEQPSTTATGQISTDRETLENSGDADLVAYAASGFARKQATTYLEPAQQGTQRPINCGYDPLKETGRTSAYKPNLQNPPRGGGYRACFVPRPGHLFCSVDYDTAELRALAQVHFDWFGRSALLDAILAGKDLHLDLAADMLAMSYDQILPRKKEPAIKARRQICKNANFGFWGGLGARGFVAYAASQGTTIHETEETATPDGMLPSATTLKDAFLSKWTEAPDYFDVIARMTRNGPATVVQSRSMRIRGDCSFTQAANTYFQGLVADWAKAATWALTQACYTGRGLDGGPSVLHGCRPVLFLHDEIIAEVPEGRASECAVAMADIMCKAAQPYAPNVPITASPALMRRWYKGADPVYNQQGELIPWEP